MRIFIIGGSGHVGAFLTQILIEKGHEVAIGGRRDTTKKNPLLKGASFISCNSEDITSLKTIAERQAFDVVVDFPGTAWNAWEVFKDSVAHVIACGSLWMYGEPKVIPTPEQFFERCFFEGYAVRFEQLLKMIEDSENHKAAFSAVMPPNICGPGKIPLDTSGGRDIEVHRANMRGETVYLPEGPQAMIMPCDAYDLAMIFALAIENREKADGQMFNGGTKGAMTVSQFVQTMGEIYGVEIPITYVSWKEYIEKYNPQQGAWWHFYAHMYPDISKAETLLGYQPKYTSKEALERAVNWMKDQGLIS